MCQEGEGRLLRLFPDAQPAAFFQSFLGTTENAVEEHLLQPVLSTEVPRGASELS